MKFLELNHPFFIPLWRRWAVVLVSGVWGLFEFATGSPFWGILFCALAIYCVWGFFFAFDPPEDDSKGG